MNHFLSFCEQYISVIILNYWVNNGIVNVSYYQSLVLIIIIIIIMGVISKSDIFYVYIPYDF